MNQFEPFNVKIKDQEFATEKMAAEDPCYFFCGEFKSLK